MTYHSSILAFSSLGSAVVSIDSLSSVLDSSWVSLSSDLDSFWVSLSSLTGDSESSGASLVSDWSMDSWESSAGFSTVGFEFSDLLSKIKILLNGKYRNFRKDI